MIVWKYTKPGVVCHIQGMEITHAFQEGIAIFPLPQPWVSIALH